MTPLLLLLLGFACAYFALVLCTNWRHYVVLNQGTKAIAKPLYEKLQAHFNHHAFASHIAETKRQLVHRCLQACGRFVAMFIAVTLLWLYNSYGQLFATPMQLLMVFYGACALCLASVVCGELWMRLQHKTLADALFTTVGTHSCMIVAFGLLPIVFIVSGDIVQVQRIHELHEYTLGGTLLAIVIITLAYHIKQSKQTPVPIDGATNYTQNAHHSTQAVGLLIQHGYAANQLMVVDALAWNASCVHSGKHKRLLLGKQLVTHLQADEQAAVVAHELGHSEEQHSLYLSVFRVVCDWLYITGAVYICFVLAVPVPVLFGLLILATFLPACRLLTAPVYNLLARYCEKRADIWATNATSKASMHSALITLYANAPRHLITTFLFYLLYFSHPAPHSRLLFLCSFR